MSPAKPTPALYSANGEDDWIDVEIVGRKYGRPILREVGKTWPGVWLADWRHIAVFMVERGAA